mmetsp:Transcript_5701/g.13763  ORF Transcript_5701/g.13763 Transcript_5701/m.13763 type:complete len:207 (+) Transcript_5701:88-708(+)
MCTRTHLQRYRPGHAHLRMRGLAAAALLDGWQAAMVVHGSPAASTGASQAASSSATSTSSTLKRRYDWNGARHTGHLSSVRWSKQWWQTHRWRHGSRMVSLGSVRQATHSGASSQSSSPKMSCSCSTALGVRARALPRVAATVKVPGSLLAAGTSGSGLRGCVCVGVCVGVCVDGSGVSRVASLGASDGASLGAAGVASGVTSGIA